MAVMVSGDGCVPSSKKFCGPKVIRVEYCEGIAPSGVWVEALLP